MEFLTQNTNWIILGIAAVAFFAIGRFSRNDNKEGVLSKIFENNKEFDTTIGLVGMFLVLFTMLAFFGDDLTDDIPMVFLMAFYALRDIVTGKKGNGHDNGQTRTTDA